MEPNALPGGMYSTMSSGMLGLEMSLHHQPQHQPPPQNPHLLQQHPPPQMVPFGHHEAEHHPQIQQSPKQGYPFPPRAARPNHLTLSDEDEPGLTGEDSAGGDGKRKSNSPWQRMKWTDNMVRLLIRMVFAVEEESGTEWTDPTGKKKCGGGVLQKKGKWKSVSRAMMDQGGFYVSPQQCEDKFNDLNKRYKRVNDILGKGTACRVVENQSLLETMDDLSPKMKEEVKKLLNSKHLYFREMCAYHHSSSGGGNGGGSGAPVTHHSPEVVAEQFQIQQQRLFHASENPPIGHNSGRMELERSRIEEEDEDDDEEEDDEEDDDEVEDDVTGTRGHEHGCEEANGRDATCSRKRPRKGMLTSSSPLVQQLSSEMMSVVQDVMKSPLEKRHWIKNRLMQLEEQRVSHQFEAFELEKQRLKWVKFSSKKEREMERDKLKNERMRLENERMLLLLRQKEFELVSLQQQQQQQLSSN